MNLKWMIEEQVTREFILLVYGKEELLSMLKHLMLNLRPCINYHRDFSFLLILFD